MLELDLVSFLEQPHQRGALRIAIDPKEGFNLDTGFRLDLEAHTNAIVDRLLEGKTLPEVERQKLIFTWSRFLKVHKELAAEDNSIFRTLGRWGKATPAAWTRTVVPGTFRVHSSFTDMKSGIKLSHCTIVCKMHDRIGFVKIQPLND